MKIKSMVIFWLLLSFILLPVTENYGQDYQEEIQIYRVKTRDGNEFIGQITQEDDEKLVIATEKFGNVTIRKTDVLTRELINSGQMKDGKLWFENPQSTRYFFSPNGYGLKPGESYYQNVWIFFNQFSFGITENFSMSAGIVPLFLFAGAPTPVWLNPKFSIPVVKDKYNVGAGALLGTVIGGGGAFGILYGVNTFGNRDKNITLGLGWGFSDGEIANSPTITLGGMIRTGPRGYFLTENYIINTGFETFGMLSFGGRRIIGDVGLDYGLILPISGNFDSFIAVPWLGLTVPLRKK
ncbi:DUF1292 domain-containing protein [Cecembia rubra]|uniref:Uncharacterized protein n=1 Tax=Cecembia rubra TaxID=1485585 RepID=A0A2P8DW42_9BACT|nr:DUF1292 domain-containing protein [Cecembia rubra]PSL01414.1 hypothetical protein CLV48_1137 [Cecembia rubra]